MKDMDIRIPRGAEMIIERLQAFGREAYVVGGCVRDSLMGKIPGDWDITTSAQPGEITEALQGLRIIPTGIKHGTVTVLSKGNSYEVTTYRVDGKYSDGRRPDKVKFTQSLREDLLRRDFTINAMAYNYQAGLVDCFNGREDLTARVIRCVGNPRERFSEDYLRIMRAYRFAAVLHFRLDGDTKTAARELKEKVRSVSAERIQGEFNKLLLSSHFSCINEFFDELSSVLFPEVENIKGSGYEHTMEVLRNTPADLILRLAAVFHNTGKGAPTLPGKNGAGENHAEISAGIAERRLRDMKYDNHTRKLVVEVIKNHSQKIIPQKPAVKDFLRRVGDVAAGYVFAFQMADKTAGAGGEAAAVKACLALKDEILRSEEPYQIHMLDIGGNDIMEALRLPPGPEVKKRLDSLLDVVIQRPEMNQRELLLDYLKSAHGDGC